MKKVEKELIVSLVLINKIFDNISSINSMILFWFGWFEFKLTYNNNLFILYFSKFEVFLKLFQY